MQPTKEVRKRYRENNREKINENNKRTNKFAFAYKGKTVYVGHNPRKGICTQCGKQKKTVLHHEKYDDDNPLAHTVELCYQCHKITHDKINKKNQEDAEALKEYQKIMGTPTDAWIQCLRDAEKYKELQIIPDDVITAHDIHYWKEIVERLNKRIEIADKKHAEEHHAESCFRCILYYELQKIRDGEK